jgi:hypothetical protein
MPPIRSPGCTSEASIAGRPGAIWMSDGLSGGRRLPLEGARRVHVLTDPDSPRCHLEALTISLELATLSRHVRERLGGVASPPLI